jgi:hypothetical protein
MRILLLLFIAASVSGCRSREVAPSPPDSFGLNDGAIREALQNEPAPLPQTTPYDADEGKRGAYLEGFRRGWDCGTSGAFLRGTFGTPAGLADSLRPAWQAGWDCGSALGIDRYSKEREKRAPKSANEVHPLDGGSPVSLASRARRPAASDAQLSVTP